MRRYVPRRAVIVVTIVLKLYTVYANHELQQKNIRMQRLKKTQQKPKNGRAPAFFVYCWKDGNLVSSRLRLLYDHGTPGWADQAGANQAWYMVVEVQPPSNNPAKTSDG